MDYLYDNVLSSVYVPPPTLGQIIFWVSNLIMEFGILFLIMSAVQAIVMVIIYFSKYKKKYSKEEDKCTGVLKMVKMSYIIIFLIIWISTIIRFVLLEFVEPYYWF